MSYNKTGKVWFTFSLPVFGSVSVGVLASDHELGLYWTYPLGAKTENRGRSGISIFLHSGNAP